MFSEWTMRYRAWCLYVWCWLSVCSWLLWRWLPWFWRLLRRWTYFLTLCVGGWVFLRYWLEYLRCRCGRLPFWDRWMCRFSRIRALWRCWGGRWSRGSWPLLGGIRFWTFWHHSLRWPTSRNGLLSLHRSDYLLGPHTSRLTRRSPCRGGW